MPLSPSVDNGAPLSFGGVAVQALADGDAVLTNTVMGALQKITPTTARAITLPALSSVQDGDSFSLINLGTVLNVANLSPGVGDNVNDGAGPVVVDGGTGVHIVADVAGGSWLVY